jgi:hypothetical protein
MRIVEPVMAVRAEVASDKGPRRSHRRFATMRALKNMKVAILNPKDPKAQHERDNAQIRKCWHNAQE